MLDTAVLKCQAPLRVSLRRDFSDIPLQFLVSFKIRVHSDEPNGEPHCVLWKVSQCMSFKSPGTIVWTTPKLDTRTGESFGYLPTKSDRSRRCALKETASRFSFGVDGFGTRNANVPPRRAAQPRDLRRQNGY